MENYNFDCILNSTLNKLGYTVMSFIGTDKITAYKYDEIDNIKIYYSISKTTHMFNYALSSVTILGHKTQMLMPVNSFYSEQEIIALVTTFEISAIENLKANLSYSDYDVHNVSLFERDVASGKLLFDTIKNSINGKNDVDKSYKHLFSNMDDMTNKIHDRLSSVLDTVVSNPYNSVSVLKPVQSNKSDKEKYSFKYINGSIYLCVDGEETRYVCSDDCIYKIRVENGELIITLNNGTELKKPLTELIGPLEKLYNRLTKKPKKKKELVRYEQIITINSLKTAFKERDCWKEGELVLVSESNNGRGRYYVYMGDKKFEPVIFDNDHWVIEKKQKDKLNLNKANTAWKRI